MEPECYMGLNEACGSLRKNCTISTYNMDAILNSFEGQKVHILPQAISR